MKYKLAILTSHPIQYQAPLFREMAKNPNLDIVVYFRNRPPEYDVEFGRNVVWDIPLLNGYSYYFLKNIFDFGVQLKNGRYSAILIYGWNSLLNWFAIILAKMFGVKIILQSENPLNQELLKPKWKLQIKKVILGAFLFKLVDAFLYIGKENKKFYKYYGVPDEKLFFTPYAVDNARFQRASETLKVKRQLLREKLGIKENDVAILFVGKLIPKKRPIDLLKAFGLLTTHYSLPTTHLILVGSGELEEQLKQYVKGQMQLTEKHSPNSHSFVDSHYAVHFVGFKNQTELPEYYTMADIFVLPSGMGETWGLVVNEAMNFGLPVIVSDMVGCGPDLVHHGENGFIYKLGDINQLANYLMKLIFAHSAHSSNHSLNLGTFVNLCCDPNHSPNSHTFADSHYGLLEKFGRRSFDIIQNYNYKKDIQVILRALNQII